MASNSRDSDPAALTTLHVRRAVSGDRESLGWLVRHLTPLLVAHARYRLGPELRRLHDPEDLVQDAWLVVLPKLGELAPRDGRHTPVLLRYLSTALLHRVQNLLRQQVRRRRKLGNVTEEDPARAASEDSGVVSRAVRDERRDRVTEALDALPALDREVVVLRGIEQLGHEAVGSIVGLGPKAACMRYLRALRRLRQTLRGSVFDELEE